MIPAFTTDGNLPSGIHLATWDEVSDRFGGARHRERLLRGLSAALAVFRAAGCNRVYLDGSFVTSKRVPQDYDALWEPANMDVAHLLNLEPVFGIFDNERAAQKAKYFGEFFPADHMELLTGRTFLDFFQFDKQTGNPKGIVALDL